MKKLLMLIIKLFLSIIAFALAFGAVSYTIVGIDFCIEGLYSARQAVGHFLICGMYAFFAWEVFKVIDSPAVSDTAELFTRK